MMNKRGIMALRDIIFMVLIFSGIIAFASILVTDLGTNYDNANMTTSFNSKSYGNETLISSSENWTEISSGLDGSLPSLLGTTLTGTITIFREVITAPATFSQMVVAILVDLNVPRELAQIFGFMVALGLIVLVIFSIVSFLKGGSKV